MPKLSDFDFKLPPVLIAQAPANPRDYARLLVYDRSQKSITDDYFYNLENYLVPMSTLVLNNSKVEKCRLRFDGIEIFVIETINPTTIRAMVWPGKKFKVGSTFNIDLEKEKLNVFTSEVDETGLRIIRLNKPINDPSLDPYKLMPFPPYIGQDESLDDEYQTVYARPVGSRASPTAGLHFTRQQLAALAKTHSIAELTLHVGLGTFAPVKAEQLSRRTMHREWYEVNAAAAKILNLSKHITAVGTTSARTLESLNSPIRASSGETDIFITPPYKFKNVDSLITNFHLPKSTLLMLTAAMIGSVDELHRIYSHAIASKYRFYSFGDAMIIL